MYFFCILFSISEPTSSALRGKTFAGRKFCDLCEFGQIRENLTREKYFCKNWRKFILHEMNFKGQLDEN